MSESCWPTATVRHLCVNYLSQILYILCEYSFEVLSILYYPTFLLQLFYWSLKLNNLMMIGKQSKIKGSESCVSSPAGCVCLWAVVQTWWGGCLLMVFAQSGAIKQVLLGPEPSLPSLVCSCVLIWGPWADRSLCPPRWLICSVHPSLQPVLAFTNWQLKFDFAHWPPLHPWKCVFQIRFTECAQHPGVEDRVL